MARTAAPCTSLKAGPARPSRCASPGAAPRCPDSELILLRRRPAGATVMAATQGAPASAHAGMAGSVLLAGTGLAVADSEAQQPGVRRSPVLQQDLALARGQAVQVRVDFDVAAVSARHSHPGEEIAYVLKGVLEYTLEG